MVSWIDYDTLLNWFQGEDTKRGAAIAAVTLDQFSILAPKLKIPSQIANECLASRDTKFESHPGYDFVLLNLPELSCPQAPPCRVGIYFRKDLLLFASGNQSFLSRLTELGQAYAEEADSIGRFLYGYFERLVLGDMVQLENMEQTISDLEETLLSDERGDYQNYIRKIIGFRKDLMVLKRYYDQLYDIAEQIRENENRLFEPEIIRNFRIFEGRVDRLCDFVAHLRDYVTQVREAYQAQVDMNSNNVMKFFTVITAIFLPLTLIAGWYGMNLKMPEYELQYGYPVIIGVSAVVVLIIVLWCKKKKWF